MFKQKSRRPILNDYLFLNNNPNITRGLLKSPAFTFLINYINNQSPALPFAALP